MILATLLLSCRHDDDGKMRAELDRIDSIATSGRNRTADSLLKKIDPAALASDDLREHYRLIDTHVRVARNKPLDDTAQIDQSIGYFTKNNDMASLSRMYYYKSCIYEKDAKRYLSYMKKAEAAEKSADLPWLRALLYTNIARENYRSGAYRTGIEYGRKMLRIPTLDKHVAWKCSACNTLAIGYLYSGMKDSAAYYLKKVEPFISQITLKEDRMNFYTNTGIIYINLGLNEKACDMFEKALKEIPSALTRANLAEIYCILGRKAEARKLLKEAWQDADYSIKSEILRIYGVIAEDEKHFKEASDYYRKSQTYNDSAVTSRKTEEVIAVQKDSDSEEEARNRDTKENLTLGIVAAVVLAMIVIAVVAHRRRINRVRKIVDETGEKVTKYTAMLEEAERSKIRNESEIKQLRAKLNEAKTRHAAVLGRGQRLCERLFPDGTTAEWSKADFEAAVEYIRGKKPEEVESIETEYGRMTAHGKFFLLMESVCDNTNDLARIMNISPSAVRTMRHRLRKRKIVSD